MDITNSIGMKLALIPAGEFLMGSPEGEAEREDDEYQHRVRITKPFYLGVYEVTVGQFGKFVSDTGYKTDAERNKDYEGAWGFNAATGEFERSKGYSWRQVGFPQGDDHPVVNVSHNDAVAFCDVALAEGGTDVSVADGGGVGVCVPGGDDDAYYHGDDAEGLSEVGNVADGTAKSKFSDWTGRSPGATAMCLRRRWGSTRRMDSACTTCMETCGSGARTGTRRTITGARRWTIQRGLREARSG